ncbi:MAG: hypothetical protein QF570_03540 [Myxococcota bacterium]|jgi:hypothetical protein|nr:hypothetical protein [Myxococcota bacterium]
MKCSTTALLMLAALVVCPLPALAGGKIVIDDTKWISVGAGIRTSFKATEDGADSASDLSNDFRIDNARLYINGQIHEYIKFEFNTDCVFCGNSNLESFALLDAIAKVELNQYLNLWAGRLIVPGERQEMNGPFYSSTFDAYQTPFVSSDFSTNYGAGGAGVYARDQGVNLWGALGEEREFQYVFGVFQGLQSRANQKDHPLVAGRFAYNFLNVESNPGYYTSGTYYGAAGDIFTVAGSFQWQQDGAGSENNPGDYLALMADVLGEKVFDGGGVVTFNGEYKYFDSDYDADAFADADNFGMFSGDAFSVALLYLCPNEVGVGRLQPYAKFSGVYPDDSSNRDELEVGLNYIISGHNASVSLFYQYGDIETKGINYGPNGTPSSSLGDVDGDEVSSIVLGMQIQI